MNPLQFYFLFASSQNKEDLPLAVSIDFPHLAGVSGELRRAGADLHSVPRTPGAHIGGFLQAHLPQTKSLALRKVQSSDPQTRQARKDHHQRFPGHGSVGTSVAPVSLQKTEHGWVGKKKSRRTKVSGQRRTTKQDPHLGLKTKYSAVLFTSTSWTLP